MGTIRVEPELCESSWRAWDDSTLETLLTSFAHCDGSAGRAHQANVAPCLVTLARYNVATAGGAQTVVLANRAQLLRDLEAEYHQLSGRWEL